ncbi:MAG: hypothetical protein SPH93_04800 [Clostridium sp.]|uniref:hypothetical protein n=1 Tax=Clostridium sp. TaxID=1506 RepID=UPI002A90C87D|nr:hypothetical protein [Clostridium sp.]MDY6226981.1 hypothetical protein [Clostridium sp.]
MKFEHAKLGKEEYDLIFKNVNDIYVKYCQIWLETVEEKMNLKKLQIRDIYNSDINPVEGISKKFESYMYSFMSGLDELYLEILFKLELILEVSKRTTFIGRVKKQESIVDKIYRKMKEENGTFSINKYLNDLLGFRIIDPYYKDNIEAVNELVDSYKEIGLNIIGKYRCNNGYEAYHIYLKYCNNTFPIEIQIWDKEKEHSNIEFHKVYKQGYVGSIIENYNKF